MLWPALVSLLTIVALALIYPLWRDSARPLPAGLEDADERQALADEKRRLLAGLRRLRDAQAEGRVDEADYAEQEAETQQALAAVMAQEAPPRPLPAAPPARAAAPRKTAHRLGSLGLLLVLAAPALLLRSAFAV